MQTWVIARTKTRYLQHPHLQPPFLCSCGADQQLLALDRRMGTAVQQAKMAAPLTSLALCDNELYLAAGGAGVSTAVVQAALPVLCGCAY